VKAGGKQNSRLAEISDYIGSRREMEDSKSVPVGSLLGQNELQVPTGSHIQPNEPIGGKKRITSRALKTAVCAGIGRDRGEVVRGRWAENRGVLERRRDTRVETGKCPERAVCTVLRGPVDNPDLLSCDGERLPANFQGADERFP
jgi:hypothetical protein